MKRVKWFLFLLPALFLLALSPSVALADTRTFNVTQDTYANLAYPDKVNGGYDHITLSNKHTDRLGYLQFESIDLPEGAIIDQANFKFYVYSVYYATTAKLNVGPISDSWEEGSLTWNTKPAVNQAQATEATIELSQGWKTVSATNLVKKWFDGSLENQGLFVYPFGFLYATPETEFALTMRSDEHSENQPVLEVEYHLPEPSPEPSPSPETEEEVEEEETTEEAEAEDLVVTPSGDSEASQESPSPEPERKEGLVLSLTPGQAVIAGLIILALAGAGIASFIYAQKKSEKKPAQQTKKKEEKPQEEE